MTKRRAEELADIVAYHFGEVETDEREQVETALATDPVLLREYFALKRHLETPAEAPPDAVRERLRASVEDTFPDPKQTARASAPIRFFVMAAALAASVVGIWWQLSAPPDGNGPDGQWVDTARTQPVSETIL